MYIYILILRRSVRIQRRRVIGNIDTRKQLELQILEAVREYICMSVVDVCAHRILELTSMKLYCYKIISLDPQKLIS